LAAVLGTNDAAVADAIAKLCAPDPASRNPELDGRRLVHEHGFQYRVTSHEIYRAVRNEEDRRAYNRDAQRRSREKKAKKSKPSNTVNDIQLQSSLSAHTEAEAEAEGRKKNGSEKEILAPLGVPALPADFLSFWGGIKSPRTKGLRSPAYEEWKKAGRLKPEVLIPQWNAYLASLGDTFPKDVCRWLKNGGATEIYELPPTPIRSAVSAQNLAVMDRFLERHEGED
jgi:hypothetical protein